MVEFNQRLYDENGPDKFNCAYSSVSVGHTYGNIVSVITNYLTNIFPKDYFKHIQIASKIAYREFAYRKNNLKELEKKKTPILMMKPRIVINDSDRFLQGTYLTDTFFQNSGAMNFGELLPFIEDKENQIYIKYKLNRMVVEFDVVVATQTFLEQLNVLTYLQNKLPQNKSFIIETALESNVDKGVLNQLSKEIDIPMYDENNSVNNFLAYINKHSYFPVTYKYKNSTGNDEFFRHYPANLDVTVGDISCDDISKNRMINADSIINFTVRVEFNGAGMYYYFTRNDVRIDGIDLAITTPSGDYVPIFSFLGLIPSKEELDIPEDWDLYNQAAINVENNVYDYINIKSLFDKDTINVISYNLHRGNPGTSLLRVLVKKDDVYLKEIIDYKIDYKTMDIFIGDCDKASTYRIYIYINKGEINNINSLLSKNKKELPSFRMASEFGTDDEKLLKVIEEAKNIDYDHKEDIIKLTSPEILTLYENCNDTLQDLFTLQLNRINEFVELNIDIKNYNQYLNTMLPVFKGRLTQNKITKRTIRNLNYELIKQEADDKFIEIVNDVKLDSYILCAIPIDMRVKFISCDGQEISQDDFFKVDYEMGTGQWGIIKFKVYMSKKPYSKSCRFSLE